MPIKIGTGSGAVEPIQLRLAGDTRPVSRVMVGIGNDAVPAYERAILPLQPMIVGSPAWTYLPDNAEYGKFAEFTVSGKGKGRFKVNVATFVHSNTGGKLTRSLSLRHNGVTIATWESRVNGDDWIVIDSLSDEFDFPEDAKIEVWGELTQDYWENRHYRWWRVEVVPSEVQNPSALIPISLWGGQVRSPDPVFATVVFDERVRGSGMVNIAASLDTGGVGPGGESSRIIQVRINGSLLGTALESVEGRSTLEFFHEEVYLEDDDQVTVSVRNSADWEMVMYGWTVDIIPLRVEEPVDPEPEVVKITSTSERGAQDQLHAALTDRGLDPLTVEYLPFDLDVSGSTNLSNMFNGMSALREVPEMDTTGVRGMRAMFQNCSSLEQLPDLDTSDVDYMMYMFQGCSSLTEIPDWLDTSKVTNHDRIFAYCSSLAYIPEIDGSASTNMYGLFTDCSSLVNAPAVTNTENVTRMAIMFSGCVALAYVPDMNTENVTDMTSMFSRCSALTDGNVLLFGKHPDVDTTNMIEGSGLTVEPFFAPAVETQTALAVVPSEVTEGESFTLTATVTPTDAVGSVTFTVAGETSTVVVVNGTATGTLTVDMLGEHEVSADFVPTNEADFLPSSGTGSLTVLEFVPAVETSTSLSVVPNEITEGEQVTLTATVTPSSAVGEVTFAVGTQTYTVALAGGTASTTATLEIPGGYEATAEFVPTDEADFLPSSDTASITVIPAPVETTTTLTVVPDEIGEGELVTVTATVTPVEAEGVVEFDVAGQLSTVNVVNGEAVATATLDEAGEHAITADFVPTSELDFLPSSATSSITVTEPASAGVVPMEWGSTDSQNLASTSEITLAEHTVVGSGEAKFVASWHFPSVYNSGGNYHRYVRVFVNGVRHHMWSLTSVNSRAFTGAAEWTPSIVLQDGDVVSFRVENRASTLANRRLDSWSFGLVPVNSLDYSTAYPIRLTVNNWTDLWSGTAPESGTRNVALAWDWDIRGNAVSTASRFMELRLNGNLVQQWEQSLTSSSGDNLPWVDSVTVAGQSLEAGDVLTVRALSRMNDFRSHTINSWSITTT